VTCSTLSISGSNNIFVIFGGTFNAGETIVVTTTYSGAPGARVNLRAFALGWLAGPYPMPGTLTYTFPAAATDIFRADFWPVPSWDSFTYTITCTPYALPYQGLHATDGRINAWDVGYAPVAIYKSSTGIKIYAVDPATSKSVLVLTISQGKISATDSISQNTLLGQAVNPFSGQTIWLYRLTTGEFSLVTAEADGKPYVGVWATGESDFYHP
jgi:hypothetical protein